MPEMKLETSAHETMEATLRQSMEGRKGEKAKSYLTKHAVTEEKEPSDFSLHVKNAPIQEGPPESGGTYREKYCLRRYSYRKCDG